MEKVINLEDAIVSSWEIMGASKRTMRGAVYDARGKLVAESQRKVPKISPVQTSNPDRVKSDDVNIKVGGSWLYAGYWNNHYGHFITECLTRFYLDPAGYDGVICHPNRIDVEVKPWQRFLLARLGWDAPVLLTRTGCRVDKLTVTEPQVIIETQASSLAVDVWSRVAYPPNPYRNVFVSRSQLNSRQVREPDNDSLLDDVMRELGFEVFFPEKLSIQEQLQLMSEAKILVGSSGSALHSSAFMSKYGTVIEIGDMRSRNRPLPTQDIIDKSIGRRSHFVPFFRGKRNRFRNLERTQEFIEECLCKIM